VRQWKEQLTQRSSLGQSTFIFNLNPQLGSSDIALLGYDVTNLLGHYGVSSGWVGPGQVVVCKGLLRNFMSNDFC
jgi:hypothetical protein